MDAHLSQSLSNVNRRAALRHCALDIASTGVVKTIEQVRRERLRLLLVEAGSIVALNGLLNMTERDSTFSQILSERTKKNMGSPLARRLELACHKPTGWMDTDPDLEWPFMGIQPGAYRDLDPRIKGMIEQAAHDILQRHGAAADAPKLARAPLAAVSPETLRLRAKIGNLYFVRPMSATK